MNICLRVFDEGFNKISGLLKFSIRTCYALPDEIR